MTALLLITILAALIFDFTNGAHDSANVVAPVISCRALSPRAALLLSGILNFVGACLGTKVAETLGREIVSPAMVMDCHYVILAALVGAILWNLLTWHLGLPSSSSHALIGGLVGAGIAVGGWGAPSYSGILFKVLIPLVVAPLLGLAGGYAVMLPLSWLVYRRNHRRSTRFFRRLQILAAAMMALGHGLNDAQKTMGMIALALFIFGRIDHLFIPGWVQMLCAAAIGAGTLVGGWKIIRTVGGRIFRMRPLHGFAAQISTALVLWLASAGGCPVSTSQAASSSILGVGSAKSIAAVRWGVARRMAASWVLTLPCAALTGAGCAWVLGMLA